ncbi:MAG: terpene cyclase/mutase family protein [Planctomycetes bacterium]|nr:terpene cyclase/mutase family protein [Planctomycetota bacterium]
MIRKPRLLRRLACALLLVALPGPLLAQTTAPAKPAGPDVPSADPPEITPATKASIDTGLKFLASTQNRDGSWRSRGANGGYPVAMTSLCGLALLSSGSTPTQGPYARQISSALTFLLKSARRDGLIAQVEEESHCMHGHGFAMLFLAQCLGVEEDPQRMAQIRLALQRAIELTARSQSAAGGWLYTPDSGGDEGSVTVTQVQGMRAARNAGLAVPKRVIDNAMSYIEKSTNADGGIRYQVTDSGPSRPAISAAAVVCYFNAGLYDDPRAKKAAQFVDEQLSPANTQSARYFGHYFYAHLYMAQVKYLLGGQQWQDYFSGMRQRLIESQSKDDGSWDGDHVGPTYGTAIALIILQLPYKALPIMQR